MTKYRSLDLNDTDVICTLMALDTQPGLPGCPPHVSHFGREYWKPQIEKSQISAIQTLFTKFQVQWHELFSKFNAKFYFPRAEPSVPSPWTRLNSELMNLATNICAICAKLTGAQDMFLASSRDVPAFTVVDRTRRQPPLDALLQSLYQLSESESSRPTTNRSRSPLSVLNRAVKFKSPGSCVV